MYGALGLKAESPEPGGGARAAPLCRVEAQSYQRMRALPLRNACPVGTAQAALDPVGSQFGSIHPAPPTLSESFAGAGGAPRWDLRAIQQLASLFPPAAQASQDTGFHGIWGTQPTQARVCSHSPSTAMCPGHWPSSGAQMEPAESREPTAGRQDLRKRTNKQEPISCTEPGSEEKVFGPSGANLPAPKAESRWQAAAAREGSSLSPSLPGPVRQNAKRRP